ncbi:MAG TPA: peptidoglycan DD-metalloendopeptidase family protein [Ideonella sp.]|nr:peptidoglycan DD-metalloendopeptidase family protein [Ideonella sp.]
MSDRFSLHALQRALAPARAFVAAHPRSLSGSVLALLAGFGITAFGIAPMAPDASDLPQRLISEAIAPEALDGQLEALASHALQLTRSDVTRASDTADSLLRRLGVVDAGAAEWLRADATARRVLEGRPGKMVSATLGTDGRLQALVARYPADEAAGANQFTRLRMERSPDGAAWRSTQETAPLVATARLASGTIRSSLFAATDEANIPDTIATQMAEMFATEIDFHRELRKGDTFSVVFEALTADGEPVLWNQGNGRVLAAEFVNDGRSHQAVWFGEGKGGYYDFNGQSKKRSFLASPMEFSRVTSGFAMRFHPILQTWRAHLGVDYGAPAGTPIRSVGDGVVDFAGWQNGYGNVVQINHSGNRRTVYAHMSRIDVRKGEQVEQGERIGAVGATGWATGPHLHFEFRVNGQVQDPLVIAKSSEVVALDAAQKPRFVAAAQRLRGQLEVAEELQGLAGRAE